MSLAAVGGGGAGAGVVAVVAVATVARGNGRTLERAGASVDGSMESTGHVQSKKKGHLEWSYTGENLLLMHNSSISGIAIPPLSTRFLGETDRQTDGVTSDLNCQYRITLIVLMV